MTQENNKKVAAPEQQNAVATTEQAATPAPEEKGFFAKAWDEVSEFIDSPSTWYSNKTKRAKEAVLDYAAGEVGEHFGIDKKYTTGFIGMLKGTNQADGLASLLGQSAFRGGLYWAGASLVTSLLKTLTGGSLDLTGSMPILVAIAGVLITGMKQYNNNAENINKDAAEKTETVKAAVKDVKDGAVELIAETAVNAGASPEKVQSTLKFAGTDLSQVGNKASKMQEESEAKTHVPARPAGPAPV